MMPLNNIKLIPIICFILLVTLSTETFAANKLPALKEIKVQSSLDKSMQPALMWAPKKALTQKTPMLVFLHSWSGNYKQKNTTWQHEAVKRGWIYLHPNFRGRNDHSQACGSKLARQDILDAMRALSKKYKVDSTRIYLAGSSGGGHMSMLMAGYHPEKFSAVSAWCGISNLKGWYQFHTVGGREGNYAKMISLSCGGPPGKSKKVDAQYKARSPWYHMKNVGQLPLDLNAGVFDGQQGSVPFQQSLHAFNEVAKAHDNKDDIISEKEMLQLWNNHKLEVPEESDMKEDKTYERDILLRRYSGHTRVTIFEGKHESLPKSACNWLAKQKRQTK